MSLTYIQAKERLLTASDEDCQQFFKDNGYILEAAYYELFHKNCNMAHKLFLSVADEDIRANWGAFLSAMCSDCVSGYPSYMEIRNFFEVDLQLLLNYYLGDYIEIICNYSNFLGNINSEVYKYMGRVFMKNNYTSLGLLYLKHGEDYFYRDPELHYLLAEYYYQIKDYNTSRDYINKCLRLLPEYYPAVKMYKLLNTL